uniref:Uncharacterized protein n=1 Tax=Panagrolaimus sp. ES5 TaxID=591445 RepID=A0AC34F576_9BILA
MIPLEDISAQTLKASSINIEPCHVTTETMNRLCAQNRKTKINCLSLRFIDGLLDPKMFMDFLKVKFMLS